MAFFTRMAWYDASQNDTEIEGFSFRARSHPKTLVILWSNEEWKKPGYFHCIHCSVCSDPQNEWICCCISSLWSIYMYAKGVVKPPRKTGHPGFLSLLKCVRQHMWHLLRSDLQSSAVTHDWNSALQTLRVTIWSCKHRANKVQKLYGRNMAH